MKLNECWLDHNDVLYINVYKYLHIYHVMKHYPKKAYNSGKVSGFKML